MNKQTIAEKRTHYQHTLSSSLQQIVQALHDLPQVERAILFGSYAAGSRDLFTDLDILIVMDSELDFVSRTAEMYRHLCCPVDVDLLVYTPQELERNQDRAFLRQILEKGTTIYEKHTP